MSPGVWYDRKRQFGVQEAIRVMEFEHSHLKEMSSCIRENDIDCDLRLLEGLDIYHDEATFLRAVHALEDMREHAPTLASRYSVYTSKADLRHRKCADHCIGAIGMPSASMWPYKMVTALLKKMVNENSLAIQTNTVVTSITDKDADEFAIVKTTRGEIRATHVVHATNAWMSHLVPELRPFVSPVRANVQRQMPQPSSLRVDKTTTFWLRYADKDYDYMLQRPDGAFIIGRANMGRRATSDDSVKDLLPQTHLRTVTPQLFDFGTDKIDISHSWSGIVGFTEDGNPFVGRLPFPNRHRQWVCGAYQGIGMVRAFRSAQMLGLLLLGHDIPSSYPSSMLVTEARFKNLKHLSSSKL
jgi:glycine/D-amino acid oxidase-like deaminating enzyme